MHVKPRAKSLAQNGPVKVVASVIIRTLITLVLEFLEQPGQVQREPLCLLESVNSCSHPTPGPTESGVAS